MCRVVTWTKCRNFDISSVGRDCRNAGSRHQSNETHFRREFSSQYCCDVFQTILPCFRLYCSAPDTFRNRCLPDIHPPGGAPGCLRCRYEKHISCNVCDFRTFPVEVLHIAAPLCGLRRQITLRDFTNERAVVSEIHAIHNPVICSLICARLSRIRDVLIRHIFYSRAYGAQHSLDRGTNDHGCTHRISRTVCAFNDNHFTSCRCLLQEISCADTPCLPGTWHHSRLRLTSPALHRRLRGKHPAKHQRPPDMMKIILGQLCP